MRKHILTNHTDTGSIRKVIEDHNCETCHQIFNSKKSLKKHMRKKHTSIGKHVCETCERTLKETQTLRLHTHQDHENGSDDEGDEMEIIGNHEDKDEDNFEKESIVNSDVEAFKEAPGTTRPSMVNKILKNDFMDTANDQQDIDYPVDESKINETLIGTKVETQGNVNPPHESVPEGRKIKHPDPG